MKKTLSVLIAALALITVLAVTSCNNDDSPKAPSDGTQTEHYEDYYNKYLFIEYDSLPYRVNIETAVATPVCPDPLCDHADESCIFYCLTMLHVVGDDMYYVRGSDDIFKGDLWGQLCRFNLVSGEWTILYETDASFLDFFLVTDEYVFFAQMAYYSDESDSGSSMSGLYDVYRYDLKQKKTEILTDEGEATRPIPYAEADGRIYWAGFTTGLSNYSTDVNYENRIDGDAAHGGINSVGMGKYYFKEENLDKSERHPDVSTRPGYCCKITRVDTETGEEAVIFDELDLSPVCYDGHIIYAKYEPRFLGNHKDAEDGHLIPQHDTCGGKLYICDLNGENERLLFDMGNNLGLIDGWNRDSFGQNYGSGDWILAGFPYYTVDGTEDKVLEWNRREILLINIITGETKKVRVVSAD